MGDSVKKQNRNPLLNGNRAMDLEMLGLPSLPNSDAEKELKRIPHCPFLAPSSPGMTFSCIYVGTIIANGEFLIPGVECAGEYWQCARYLLNIKINPSSERAKDDPHLAEGLRMAASIIEEDLIKRPPIPEQSRLANGERTFEEAN